MYAKYKMTSKIDEISLVNVWEKIVGTMINNHTTSIKLKGKTLYVAFDNAALKNEMFYRREELATQINTEFGKVIVEKVFVA